ncbi:alpha/beta hydrolase [Phormidesmis sp. 146-35]
MTKRTLNRLLWGDFTLGRLARSLLFIYLALGIFAYFFSERLIFQPQPTSYQDSPDILKLETPDRIQLSALHLPNPRATYTLLYSHGNAEDLGDIRPTLEDLRTVGFSVFAYDYRGYGTSQGKPSEQKSYRDIETAYSYLTTKLGVRSDRIIAFGRSVGNGPTIHLATQKSIAALIIESGFTSAFRVVLPIPIFPFDKFPNRDRLKLVRCPVLVIHGENDQVIPFWHGQALYDAANQPKQFFAVSGADHNDVAEVAGESYSKALQNFVTLIQKRPETED